ncbi:transmembrane protein 71 [Carlito syrichta]|uniref:Transmembrane protein 71 n=1 Tax=Carlito syrichta TaxID=1868482 RepID=A0A1U7U4E3_CARSF|nr:transmembrane protein 71 [Carlito syrichta]
MYRISQLMSTPVASASRLEREYAGKLSPTCVFPSFACDFLESDSSFECCSIDPLTGSHHTCRRSPRLLTNGYYIWTEDSFLCDQDGNITLNPSQTSVIYKENLVRIFRKKKRIHHSVSSRFNLGTSKSWLHESIFGDVDSPPSQDIWLEDVRRLDTDHYNKNGGDFDRSSLTDGWESEELTAESAITSSSGHITSQPPGENAQDSCLQSQTMGSAHFPGHILDHSKIGLLREVLFQTILLAVCLIISACARWFMGEILAGIFTCSLMITVVYVVKALFLSLASYFKAIACTGCGLEDCNVRVTLCDTGLLKGLCFQRLLQL